MRTSDGSVASLRGATVILGGRAVLKGVDLDLRPGITVLRGPNGAGKTTFLRALAGLLPLARGARAVPLDVLYLGHRAQLLHGLTARENLRFLRSFRGLTPRATARASALTGSSSAPRDPVDDALAAWGLARDADRPVERLSAGQRRRASLARLWTETCALTLLDEPFAELDADAAGMLGSWLTESAALGTAILVASHGHQELDRLAVRVASLQDGTIDA